MDVEDALRSYYTDWQEGNEAHHNRVEQLEELFPSTKFTHNRPPNFFAGRLDAAIVIIGLNPGYSEKDRDGEDWELKQKKGGFDNYIEFSQNFFQKCADREKDMSYYRDFSKFIRGLNDDEYKDKTKVPEYLHYLQDVGVLSLDLIPYHSNGIDTIDTDDPHVREVIDEYAEIVRDIINLHDREHVIIHGKNNLRYWTRNKNIALRRAGNGGRNRVDYTRTDEIFENTVLIRQFLPYFGWESMKYYLLGQAVR